MNSSFDKQIILDKISTGTKHAFGQEYFSVIADTINQAIEVDYIFITKIDKGIPYCFIKTWGSHGKSSIRFKRYSLLRSY